MVWYCVNTDVDIKMENPELDCPIFGQLIFMKDAQEMVERKITHTAVLEEVIESMKTQKIPDLQSYTTIHAKQITDLAAASRTY